MLFCLGLVRRRTHDAGPDRRPWCGNRSLSKNRALIDPLATAAAWRRAVVARPAGT
jgi:hypothetical protein